MDIRDVPYTDIISFLEDNKISVPKDRAKVYDKVLTSLSKNWEHYPISIVEWITAQNLLRTEVNIPVYTKSQIDNLNKNEIEQLAKLLTMKSNDINHIINILKYLHKLIPDKKGVIGLPEIDKMIFMNTKPSDFINYINLDMKTREEIIEILPALVEKWKNSNRYRGIPDLIDDLFQINEFEIAGIILNNFNEGFDRIIRDSISNRNKNILEYVLGLVPENFDWSVIDYFIFSSQPSDVQMLIDYYEFILNAAIISKSEIVDIVTVLYYERKKNLQDNIKITKNSAEKEEWQHRYITLISLEPLINKAKFLASVDKMKKAWIDVDENYDRNIIFEMENIIEKLNKLF